MEGSDRKSSAPSKSASVHTDENEQRNQEVSQASKNSTMEKKKHFMEPTISSRKKILSERNEILESTIHLQGNLNLDSKIATLGDNNVENGLEEGLSSSTYYPISNCVNPRPKFLRYKPNRRREILLQEESGVKEEKKEGIDGEGEVVGLQENNVSQESDEIEESDEEFEEVEENTGCTFSGLVKLLLLLLLLVFSTSYISSMNSPTSSPIMEGLEVGFLNNSINIGNYFLVENQGGRMGSVDIIGIGEEMIDEAVKTEGQENSEEMNGVFDSEGNGAVDDFVEGGETEALEVVEKEEEKEVRTGIEIPESGNSFEETEMKSELQDVEVEEEVEFPSTVEIPESGKSFDETTMNSDLHDVEVAEVVEVQSTVDVVGNQDVVESSAPTSLKQEENEDASEPVKEEMGDNEVQGSSMEGLELASTLKGVVGFILFSLLVPSMAWFLRKKREVRKDTPPVVGPKVEYLIEEKCNPISQIEDVISSETSKPSMGVSQIQAPSVELLGEIMVEEMSCSLRSCSITQSKTKMMIESEVSSHSVSVAHTLPVYAQPSSSEISAMDSPSYGRYTNQKTIFKKEMQDQIEGESKKAQTPTPVRRSNRISSRAAQSLRKIKKESGI